MFYIVCIVCIVLYCLYCMYCMYCLYCFVLYVLTGGAFGGKESKPALVAVPAALAAQRYRDIFCKTFKMPGQ